MKTLAIVIGGSSGIGFSICNKLKEEYQVVNMSRRKNEEVDNIYVDVEDYDSIKNGFKELKNKYNTLPKILVCSAGFVEPQGILEVDYDTLIKTFKVNILSVFTLTQQFVKMCDKSQENKIIYISSTAGTRASAGLSAYGSSKASLINFSNSMVDELKSYNIKTYCISPGRCNTPLRDKICLNENKDKIMQPYEVADFIYYLVKYDQVLNNQNIIIKKDIGG